MIGVTTPPAPARDNEPSPRTGRARSRLLAGIVCGILSTASLAVQAAESSAASQTQRDYDVPAGALDSALKTFASQAGVMLSLDASLTTGKSSPGLKGEYTVTRGFDLLLAGSGLEATEADGSYSVRARATKSDGSTATARIGNTQTMGKIKVEGDVAHDGSAALGYLSDSVSQVGPWQGRTLQDTPYSLTVISEDLIENLQATTPDQIYRIAPTIQFSSPQHLNDTPGVNMRGFGVWSAYRDGVPGDFYGHGTTTEDVQSVEIFTGLSGFLYGPGNVGGMINYISKRPTPDRLNQLTFAKNGGQNWYVQGDFGGPIDADGRTGYRVNGIWQDGETAIEGQDIEKRFISAAFDWHVTDTLLWQFDASYRDYEVHGGQASWGIAAGVARPSADDIDSSVSWSQPWKYTYQETGSYGTQLRWDATDSLTLRAAWRYVDTESANIGVSNTIQGDGTYTQSISGVYAPGDNSLFFEQFQNRGQLFADLSFQTGAIAHKLTTGVQYRRTLQERYSRNAPSVSFTGLSLARPTFRDRPAVAHIDRGLRGQNIDESYTSVLIGDDITFNEQWSLLAGLAHSTIDLKPRTFRLPNNGYDESAVTPSASLIFKPIQALTTYVTYIESLERGGIAADEFNGLEVVNRGDVMDPLTSDQIELGAKWSVGGLLLTTAVFQIDKALEYYDLRNPEAVRYVQNGRQVHRGIELTAFGKATEQLTLIGGFTLLDAQVKEQDQEPTLEGKQPPGVAETLAKLRAEYQLPALPALSLIGGVTYTSHQYADAMNTDRLPSYTLFDVGARYETALAERPVTLRLDVNNVADKAYWTDSGVLLGEPRTLLLSVSTEF